MLQSLLPDGAKKKLLCLSAALALLVAHTCCGLIITERSELFGSLALGIVSGAFSLGLLNRFVTRSQPVVMPVIVFLYSVGWLELLRLKPDLALKQCLWLFIACLGAILVYKILDPISLLERYRIPILLGGLTLLFSALLVGTEVNGAKLWLRIGGVSFQPIEIVKILLVVTLASFWRRFRLWLRFSTGRAAGKLPRRGMLFLATGWFSGLAILVMQRDLGMALLLIGVFFTMFYVATGRRDLVLAGVGAFFVASTLAILAFDHIRIRIRAWWDPFQFFDTDGYQLVQGLYGIADGGPWGRGLFLGRPHIIPEVHTDFILTAISHELGWIVALCVIFCTAELGRLLFQLARECRGEFRELLLTGLASLWTLQCFIIIGGTTKVIPMTGLTLPFVSYGGSSLVANTILIALALRCASRSSAGEGQRAQEPLPRETTRRIKKVARYHLYLFLLPVCSLLFYGWLKAPELNERADNPQRYAPVYRRGQVLDRSGSPLAHNESGQRKYPQGEFSGSLVGYQLHGKNHTGLESALQSRLSPPLPPATLMSAIAQDREYRQGQRERLAGPDVQLNLDSDLQRRLYERLQPHAGAVVVSNRQGQILAAVSSPSFDPNDVDKNWQALRTDPRSPFIERVGSGLYPVEIAMDKPLVESRASQGHPWFQEDTFKDYPMSSAATLIDDQALVSPLMLLQYSYALSAQGLKPSLSLIKGQAASDEATWDRLALPIIESTSVSHGFRVWKLFGRPFRDSPEFGVWIGNTQDQIFFAIVVEDTTPKESQRILEDLLLALPRS